MKNYFVFVLLCGFAASVTTQSFINLVPLAINVIIRDFFKANSEAFDFIICGGETKVSSELVNEILKLSTEILPYNVIKVPEGDESSFAVKQSAILIFETFNAFINFHSRVVLSNEFPKQFHFLVYVCDQQATQQEISSISSTPPPIFHFESFLTHAEGGSELRLLSYEAFQQPNCREWEEVEINRFSKDSSTWNSKSFFLLKFENFNGCELFVGIVYPQEPAIGIDFYRNGTMKEVSGYASKLNEIIGHYLNYSTSYNPLNAHTRRLYNGTQRIDFSIYVQKQRMQPKFIHSTLSFTATDDVILISRAKPYTVFEKLFVLYDVVKGMVATTFLVVVTASASKFAWRKLQKLNGEERVKPLVLRAFVSSLFVPRTPTLGKKLVRFLLFVHIIFVVSMQASFQRNMIEWTNNGMRRNDVRTIDEMVKENYTFHISNLAELYGEMDFLKSTSIKISSTEAQNDHRYLEYFLKDGSKRGVVLSTDTLNNLLQSSNGAFKYTTLNEKLISDHIVYWFTRNNFIFESFNRKVSQLVESGLAGKYVKDFKTSYRKTSEQSVEALTCNHVTAGTLVILVFLLSVSLSCAGEFIIRKIEECLDA